MNSYGGPVTALVREFPGWQISIRPGGIQGICTAYWESPDGRQRRVVVARTEKELLYKLRRKTARETG